ncbi:protein-ADP-ribose hydrolase [Atopobium sp. oral taxon 199]|uniref:protein-ADP-ribose hydrolase n=1 Tax=Atopobium sp. oral taxon 199 TaxID=712156 RepID=UPI00034E3A9F|nr:protein-ADP-ribose hydrolase [Atopobium sp. oral taxon 199]EPD77528.1 hypothetical protein HMPREF1527_01461 [Atopobium sp. oral taxon 199 str. F0494]
MTETRKRELLRQLVRTLCSERAIDPPETSDVSELWTAFRALVNTRLAIPAGEKFFSLQDELLQGMIAEAGIHAPAEATPAPGDSRLCLWRGDITTLEVDTIVNAANSQLLGCWVPGHYCIDNAIHTFAGVQLRAECARLMDAQGYEEPTGQAKITPAYNLPAKYVLHTVGPIVSGRPTPHQKEQLASCYRSCLDLAAAHGLTSVAFCCISTGVFGFPQKEAACIAVDTVRAWLDEHRSASAGLTVVFNVFLAEDQAIYEELLGI